ncbi:Glutaredoxin family protein [Rhynchospora pubera]|uniref:Glutaredoxin family protein n=1 Tax=Rhynchospora pubera TaxID=906938 RepID=A0AAV8HZJ3_9POAL|nr:Glutaredoxin family protein [Rhynchospora pubera]KAJ4797099.1 Glutaredoxin family protein [Rhynchospora pubera]KAJ4820892.1 Glutaredoxin family protein [Rhynchospora pubera]
MDQVMSLASKRAVVIFSASTCCMCHTVKTLFSQMGVNAAVYELDKEPWGGEMASALMQILGRRSPTPAVFIAGRAIGTTETVMTLHLTGKLVPLLRDAGALWL